MSAPFVLGVMALAVGAAALKRGHVATPDDVPPPPDPTQPASLQGAAGGDGGGAVGATPTPDENMTPSGNIAGLGGDQLAPGPGGCVGCGYKRPASAASIATDNVAVSMTPAAQTHGGAQLAKSTATKRDQLRAFEAVATGYGVRY